MINIKSLPSLSLLASAISVVGASTAFAADAAPQGGALASFVPLILIMLIFYFLLIRPQQKRLKEHRKLIESLKKGDKVITGGGFYGTVTDVKDDHLKVEIADGVRVKVKRDTIVGLAD